MRVHKGAGPSNLNLVKNAMIYLPRGDRQRIYLLIPIATALGLLDLLGVLLLGAVGTLAFKSVTKQAEPTRVELLMQQIIPFEFSAKDLSIILAITAIVVLTGRTLSQAALNLKLVKFWSRIETQLAEKVFTNFIYSEIHKMTRFKYSEYQYALTVGTNRYVLGILSSCVSLISDLISTLLITALAFMASPPSFLITGLFFGVVYFASNQKIYNRARIYGEKSLIANEELSENLSTDFNGIREIKIFSREKEIVSQFVDKKLLQAQLNQKTLLLNSVIRYLLEVVMLIVGLMIASIAIALNDARHAVTIIVLFLAVGYKLIPNIQRIQNSMVSFRNSKGVTARLFEFLAESETDEFSKNRSYRPVNRGRLEKLEVSHLDFSYNLNSSEKSLQNIDFSVGTGDRLAIIGQSGSGKSTLIDVITQIKMPQQGFVKYYFSDNDGSRSAIPQIGYVSQNCTLFGADIYEMVAFKRNLSLAELTEIEQICDSLNLKALIHETRGLIAARSDGTNISGGERQRIALARAIFAKSSLMIFDEPTSALDKENKEKLLSVIDKNFDESISIFVTHDAEILDICTHVLKLSHGKQKFYGTLAQYRNLNQGNLQ